MIDCRRRPPRSTLVRRGLPAAPPGQAIVEMALVITMLLTLTFGIADIGLFMYDRIQAANCVREAARRAAVRDFDPNNVPYCVSNRLRDALTVTYEYADQRPGSNVTAVSPQ